MSGIDWVEVGRAAGSSVAASVIGVMLGAALMGGNPVDALRFVWFTLFGSFVILTPIHLFLRARTGVDESFGYGLVVLAGVIGGFLLLAIPYGALGGFAVPGRVTWIFSIGSLYGGATALVWVGAHALLRRLAGG